MTNLPYAENNLYDTNRVFAPEGDPTAYDRRFARNLGFISVEEQQRLHDSSVAIAGAGGDGGMLAVQLARMGVGEFRLADPDPFDVENINRQAVCTSETIGTNKAVAVGEYIKKINPAARVTIYENGITEENTADFIEGTTLVIDETEFTLHALGIMLARESRKQEIPVMTALNIGFGAMVTTFRPHGVTLEKILGFGDDEPLDEISEKPVPLSRWLPFLPRYIDLSVFGKVARGEKPAPSIAPGVATAASLGSTQAFLNIVGQKNKRPSPVYARKVLVSDSMSGDNKKIVFNRLSHYRHMSSLLMSNLFKKNPKASY